MRHLIILIAILGLILYPFLLATCAQVKIEQKAPDFIVILFGHNAAKSD